MTQWYYEASGEQHGPISSSQLKQLAISGLLKPTDLVWREGMLEWLPASRIIGLFSNSPKQKQPPAPAVNVIAPPVIVDIKKPSYPTQSNFRRRKKKTHKLGKSILSLGVIALGLVLTLGGVFSILFAITVRDGAPRRMRALIISIESKEENAEIKKKGEKMNLADRLTVLGNTSGMTEDSIEEDRTKLQAHKMMLKAGAIHYFGGIVAVVLGPVFMLSGIGIFLIVISRSD
jgi:hypothetical protein